MKAWRRLRDTVEFNDPMDIMIFEIMNDDVFRWDLSVFWIFEIVCCSRNVLGTF